MFRATHLVNGGHSGNSKVRGASEREKERERERGRCEISVESRGNGIGTGKFRAKFFGASFLFTFTVPAFTTHICQNTLWPENTKHRRRETGLKAVSRSRSTIFSLPVKHRKHFLPWK